MTQFCRHLCAVAALILLSWATPSTAQTLQDVLLPHQEAVERASRKTIDPVITDLLASGLPEVPEFVEAWQAKNVWMRKEDNLFFFVATEDDGDTYDLIDISTGEVVGNAGKRDLKQLKPNSGVRAVMSAALVQFQLSDPNPARRAAALLSIERDPDASQLEPLRASIATEEDPALKARKSTLERLLTARFADVSEDRVAAITALSSALSVETRAALNPMVVTTSSGMKPMRSSSAQSWPHHLSPAMRGIRRWLRISRMAWLRACRSRR